MRTRPKSNVLRIDELGIVSAEFRVLVWKLVDNLFHRHYLELHVASTSDIGIVIDSLWHRDYHSACEHGRRVNHLDIRNR